MKGGWYIGDFLPSAYTSKEFEVALKFHRKNTPWSKHIHKKVTEINLLVHGKMKIQNKLLKTGDIFIIEKGTISDPVFLEDCEVVIVKVPSIPGDKTMVK